jgi:hypothetical protein
MKVRVARGERTGRKAHLTGRAATGMAVSRWREFDGSSALAGRRSWDDDLVMG